MKDIASEHDPSRTAHTALPHLGVTNLRDRVVDVLEQSIMDGVFPPGSRFPTEVELGAQLGVSRTVIRDAVRALEVRGLIDVRRGRGTIVRPVTLEAYAEAVATFIVRSDLTMGDLMDARIVLEAALIRAAADNRQDNDVQEIAETFDAFQVAVDHGDHEITARCHVAFHIALVRAAHLRALSALLEPIQLMMIATSVVPADEAGWAIETHAALRDAVAAGDYAAVESAIEGHWAATPSRYRTIRPRLVSTYYASARELLRAAGMLDAGDPASNRGELESSDRQPRLSRLDLLQQAT